MVINIIYGIGGYCETCDSSHDHPLNNIIETIELPDEAPSIRDTALAKLEALGLTPEEIAAIIS